MRKLKYEELLPTDVKVTVINSWKLMDDTKNGMRDAGGGLDMTCRFQLRSDITQLEKALKKADSPKAGPADFEKLQHAYLRLKTSYEHILQDTDMW